MNSQLDLFETLAGIIKPVTNAHLQKYYNTNNLTGDAIVRQAIKTGSQNWRILQWFERHPGEWSPSQVWVLTNMKAEGVPLTSIRRGITDLTKEFKMLEQTEKMRDGMYGKPEGCWRVKK